MRELARTPLILSMMTLAFGGSASGDIPTYASRADLRHRLMDAFVSRMLQRRERRQRGIPFDDNPRANIPESEYAWPPERFAAYMSWLAVRLSLSSQTACSVSAFWHLMSAARGRLEKSLEDLIAQTSETAFVVVLVIVIGASLVPTGLELMNVAGVVVLAAVLFWTHDLLVKLRSKIVGFIQGLAFFVIFVLMFGAIILGIGILVPSGMHPASIAVVVWVVAATIVVGSWVGFGDIAFLAGTIAQALVAAALTILAIEFPLEPGEEARISGTSMAVLLIAIGAHTVFWIIVDWKHHLGGPADASTRIGAAIFAATLFFAAFLGAFALADQLNATATAGLVTLVFLALNAPTIAPTRLVIATALAGAGGMTRGRDGVFGGLCIAGALFFAWDAFRAKRPSRGRFRMWVDDAELVSDKTIARAAFVPVARVMLAVRRVLPLRLVPLLRYGGQALILKPFRTEIEFSHRLLRDYFALRDLVPRLSNEPIDTRLRVVDALGYQGAAAVDTLIELFRDGEREERTAAVLALGRITAPEVVTFLAQALHDADGDTRAAAVLGLKNLAQKDREELTAIAINDADIRVQKSLFGIGTETVRKQILGRYIGDRDLLVYALTVAQPPKLDDRAPERVNGVPLGLEEAVLEHIIDGLRAMLRSPDAEAQRKACLWMHAYKRVFDRESLVACLETAQDAQLRQSAIDVLELWGGFEDFDLRMKVRDDLRRLTLIGQIRHFAVNDLGKHLWRAEGALWIPAVVVLVACGVAGRLGPCVHPLAHNALGFVAAVAAFVPFHRLWYSQFGADGTYHVKKEWWDLGFRGTKFGKRLSFVLLAVAVYLVWWFVTNSAVPPCPGAEP